MRQVKGRIGTGKGEKKGKRLGEESRGTSGRSPGCEGKGKGGFEEQRWWDEWWEMKEWSRENLEGGDFRDKKREKAKSMRLRSASLGVAEGLGEETASELRLAECWGEEATSELNKGMVMKGCRRFEEGRRVKGKWEGY